MSDVIPGSVWYNPITKKFYEISEIRDNTTVIYKTIGHMKYSTLSLDGMERWQDEILQYVAPKRTRILELLYV